VIVVMIAGGVSSYLDSPNRCIAQSSKLVF